MFSKGLRISFSILVMVLFTVTVSQNWRGNIVKYLRWESRTSTYCVCDYSWGCAQWRTSRSEELVYGERCENGWTHKGDYNCILPLCKPNCGPGECKSPNECDCKGLARGRFCQTLTCSYDRPCYPGNCYDDNKCNCTAGFTKKPSSEYGCMIMEENNMPHIGKSTTTIRHIRRADNKFMYYFRLDGTDKRREQLIVWSNQKTFNEMDFRFETTYEEPEPFAERPGYVHSTKVGITEGSVSLRVLNFKNVEHSKQKYDIPCPGTSRDNPVVVFNCTLREQEFKTLIEHADTLNVTFIAKNGGNRKINKLGTVQSPEYFEGRTAKKNVFFKFDFQAPKHCSEETEGYTQTSCGKSATMLDVGQEFTKNPVKVSWKGWTDDKYGSQMWMYYLELHKLVVEDATLQLTEQNPIRPMATDQVGHMGDEMHSRTFTPKVPGMYSILMEVRDIANNSRITRRFVLYDKVSDVELNTDSQNGLHISTATNHTGFRWQSMGSEGGDTQITAIWTGYFMNKAHEKGYYNNKIKEFKPQFEDLEDDGILSTRKFVDPRLDDNEGQRTTDAIPNINGIVKFEYQFSRDVNLQQPPYTWTEITPIKEFVTITEKMRSGDQLKVWVRAHDILGNYKIDSAMVTTDFSPPEVSSIDDESTYIKLNTKEGPFNYSSRLHLEASDTESGVRELGIDISIHVPGVPDINVRKTVKANTDDTRHPDRDKTCVQSRDKSTCFLKEQTIYLDNCWLTVPNQAFLPSASATVKVIAYNQAMVTSNVSFEIPAVKELTGLHGYTGPKTATVTNVRTGSFRITWDFPKKISCYAIQTDIFIILFIKNADGKLELVNHTLPGSRTYLDIANLEPNTDYNLTFTSIVGGKENKPLALMARTKQEPVPDGLNIQIVVGVVVGVLVLVLVIVGLLVFLIRRGIIRPQERAQQLKTAVTKKYRESFHGGTNRGRRHRNVMENPAYDAEHAGRKTYNNRKTLNETEELYMYGGMDVNMPEVQHIDRDLISFESLIKDGHFAKIYKASLRTERAQKTVVAKTLKEKFTPEDEMLMRAKINFSGTVVGEHPNVLKYLGAVVGDDNMGPFIIYEYCENGTLKDYLVSQRSHVTVELQENLFRFGLDVAKGMEYLASKGIVHRRLAARNILMTLLNEVRISGFGPQPDMEHDGGSEKQERIPIKWMAPECMTSTKDATEKSDVWSYAVVLWEIFTLGDTPYNKVKSRQLPLALKKGERLPKTEQCDDSWYGVMKSCWNYDPNGRPDFAEVRSELDKMFVAAPGDDYYYYKR